MRRKDWIMMILGIVAIIGLAVVSTRAGAEGTAEQAEAWPALPSRMRVVERLGIDVPNYSYAIYLWLVEVDGNEYLVGMPPGRAALAITPLVGGER